MSELNGNKTQSTQSSTKVKIPCRISYANIWEPKSVNGSEAKYSVSCVFPKSNQELVNKVNAAIEAAKELGRDKKWGGKIPAGPNFKTPLRDGDIERPDDENYKGCFFINTNSKEAPQIVDRRVQPITDSMECGSGDYCNVTVNFYPFNANGNRGIAAGLGNIQKIKDGERLAGRTSAASDFDDLGDENYEDLFGGEKPAYL